MSRSQNESVARIRARRRLGRGLVQLFCTLVAIVAFYPFFVMVISCTHDNFNIMSKINILPGNNLAANFERLTQNINIPRGVLNSLILSVSVTVIETYFTVMAAYAFAKFEFKGKNFLFGVVLVFMMLPGQLGIIGFFKEVQAMHLMNSYIPLIIPSIANCFAVFFYKQYMDTSLSNELIEAAIIDGCREIDIFHKLVIPLMRPAMVTQAVLTFIGTWNSYLNPLILLNDKNKFTLTLMIATVRDATHADYGAQYLGMVISVIPTVIIYCFGSKTIMEKISVGAAVKG